MLVNQLRLWRRTTQKLLKAIDAIYVDYEQLDPLVNSREAIEAAPIHPDGNVIRHLVINHGDPDAVVEYHR